MEFSCIGRELSPDEVDNASRERYLKLCNGLTATPLPIPFVWLGRIDFRDFP